MVVSHLCPPRWRAARIWALLVAFAVTGASCGPSRPELETFHASGRVDPRDFPDVPAVVLLDRSELTFTFSAEKARPYAELLRTRRIQILKEEALDLARVKIPYDSRSVIFHILGRRITPAGDVENMPADRSVDVLRYEAGTDAAKLYGDVGYKLAKVSNVEVGDVIELSYVRVYRDPRWIEPVRISGPLPVVRGEVVIDHPRAFDIDFRVTKKGRSTKDRPVKLPQRVRGTNETEEGVPGFREVFVFENERAIFPEDFRPSVEAMATQVHVQLKSYKVGGKRYTAYETWDDVAAWYRALTKGSDDEGSVASVIAALGGADGSKRSKLQRVQAFLQDEVRDVPSFLNLGALPAHSAADIAKAKVGDAKDQASLGLALLRGMGIAALPVLVSRVGSAAVVPDLPTPAPFNHVVLAIPAGGRYSFIDPSAPFLPTGRLSDVVQGQRGLLVRPNKAELIDLPEDPPVANTRKITYDLALAKTGTVAGQARVELTGIDAAVARWILKTGGERTAGLMQGFLDAAVASSLVWQEVVPVQGKAAQNRDATLKLQVVLKPGTIADARGEKLLMPLSRVVGRPMPYLWREVRYMPLVVPHRFQSEIQVKVSLPEGWGVEGLADPSRLDAEQLAFAVEWAIADGELFMKARHQVGVRAVEPAEYRQLREPMTILWAVLGNPVVLIPGGDRGEAYGTDPF